MGSLNFDVGPRFCTVLSCSPSLFVCLFNQSSPGFGAWDSGGSNGSNSYLMTGTRPKLGDGAPSGLPGRCDLSGPQIRDFNTTRTAQVLEEEGAVTEGVTMEL